MPFFDKFLYESLIIEIVNLVPSIPVSDGILANHLDFFANNDEIPEISFIIKSNLLPTQGLSKSHISNLPFILNFLKFFVAQSSDA